MEAFMTNHPIYTITNPLIATLMLQLRDQKTKAHQFRHLIRQITQQMLGPVSEHLPTTHRAVVTQLQAEVSGDVLTEPIVLYTILRAGLAMADVVFDTFANVKANYHLGLVRDAQTHQPSNYYNNSCVIANKKQTAIIVDPMIATGNSLASAIQQINPDHFAQVIVIGIIATPVGLNHVLSQAPATKIFVAAIDPTLDNNKYIVPGLGDAGDRFFNTF